MAAGFRDCLGQLEDAGELFRVKKAVDPRHLSALTAQARLPLPMMHVQDGGPYISATLVVSKDPEYGRNVGSYRVSAP